MWDATRLFWPALVMTVLAGSVASTPAKAIDPPSPDAVTTDAVAEPAADAIPQVDDYYTKRARKILETERRARDHAPHPLAADRPGEFVVVCEAGCSKPDVPEVVGAQPRVESRPAGAMLVTTSAKLDAAPIDADIPSLIECMGGCYGANHAYRSRAPLPRASKPEAEAAAGEWVTSVAPSGTAPKRDKLSPVR